MIFALVALSLLLSFFSPWYSIVALSAAVYSFRKKSHREILLTSLLIVFSHLIAAFALDHQADGLISQRIAGLFQLPLKSLSYLMVALIPALLFLVTAYVVIEGRKLARKRERKKL
ncbi:hypothetical protein GW916_09680 [bacterium]|nr:hypothetical protein [bacterium]